MQSMPVIIFCKEENAVWHTSELFIPGKAGILKAVCSTAMGQHTVSILMVEKHAPGEAADTCRRSMLVFFRCPIQPN